MTEGTVTKVDVNTGSLESLVAISGIGQGLAERIIAARPYGTVGDLARVQGISARMAERWEPLLEAAADDEVLPVLEAEVLNASGEVEEVLPEEMLEEVIETEDETAAESVEAIEFEVDAVQADEEDKLPPVIEVPEDDLIPESLPEEMDESEPVKAEEESRPEKKKKVKEAKPASGGKPLLRGDAFVLGGAVGLIAVLLAVVLSLGILGLVNGGLNFVTPAQMQPMQRQVEAIEGQISVLEQDIEGLTTRLDALDALGGRVTDLESVAENLSKDMAELQSKLGVLEQTVDELNGQMESLTQKYGIFEGFLGGMQGLLNELLPENVTPAGE